MGAAKKILDKKALQVLVPFNALSPMHLGEVSQKTRIEEVAAGKYLFKEGERDNQTVYVLEGEVNLVSGDKVMGTVRGGSEASYHPLANQQPRQISARAKTKVTLARVDSSLLDIFLTWDQSSGYEVAEINEEEDDDWMTKMLQSKAFLRLPPSNIQRLLMSVESVPFNVGDKVIEQGADGDYFYIVTKGRCLVTRRPSPNAKEVKLAELSDGDAFGEDALVSDAKRNASVTMLTDGTLMRLAKKDFVELLKEPLVNRLDYAAANTLIGKGEACWMDVRLPGEFENCHIQEARNIPLSALRLEAEQLAHDIKYIMCCDTGSRSASAAFLLSQRGHEVFVLDEGLAGVPADHLAGSGAPQPTQDVDSPTDSAEVVELPVQESATQDGGGGKASTVSKPSNEHPDYGKELERFRRFREDATQKIRETREQLGQLERDKQTAEGALEEARREIQTLQQVLEKREKSLAEQGAAGREREQLREQLEQLRLELNEAKSERDSVTQQHLQLDKQLEELQALKAQHEHRLAEEEQALQLVQQQLDDRERDLQTLRQELAAMQEAGSQADSEHGEHLQALQNDLASARQERDQSRQALATLEQQSSAGQQAQMAELDKLRLQQTAAETRITELSATLKEARANGQQALTEQSEANQQAEQSLRQEMEALGLELQQARAALQQAESHNTDLQQKLTATQSAMQLSLEEAQVSAEGQSAELQTRIEALEQQLVTAASQVAEARDLQSTLAQAEAERDGLQKTHEQALGNLQLLEQDKQAMDQELAGLRAELQNLEQEHEIRRKELAETADMAGQRDAALSKELDQTREALQQSEQQREQLQGEVAELRTRGEELDERVAGLLATRSDTEQAAQSALEEQRQALLDAERRIEAFTDEKQSLNEELSVLLEKLETLSSEQADDKQQINALQQRLEEQDRLRGESEQREQALLAEQQETQAALHNREEELQRAVSRIEDLNKESTEQCEQLQQLQSQLAAQQQELLEAGEQVGELTSVRDELGRSRLDWESKITQLQAANETLETALAEREQQHQQFEQQLQAQQADFAALQEQAQQAGAQRQELQDQVDRAQAGVEEAVAELEQVRDLAAQERDAAQKTEQALRGELEVVKASLSHEQSARGSNAASQQAEAEQRIAELTAQLNSQQEQYPLRQKELQEAEEGMKEAQQQLVTLRQALNEAQESASEREQALHSELEQLRQMTTDDVAALQQQIAELKTEQTMAADPAEIERLQLLLNEARDQANEYRRRLEALETQPVTMADDDAEIGQLRQELMAIKSQMDEANSGRSLAEQEISRLQEQLIVSEAMKSSVSAVEDSTPGRPDESLEAAAPSVNDREEAAIAKSGKGGLILGLLGGLLIGALAAGGALWYQQQGQGLMPAKMESKPETAAPAKNPASVPAPPVQSEQLRPTPARPVVKTPQPVPVVRPEPKPEPKRIQDRLPDIPTPTLIRLPAVEFSMGSSANSLDFDERPRHSVQLAAYAISQHEVTFEQYDAFASATGHALPDDLGWGRGNRPVINVSWEEAVEYTKWLSQQTQQHYRLPSEAEWEYAAGAGARNLYWWGNSIGHNRANCFNCGSEWDGSRTAPVGRFAANPLGLQDSAGNVAEWVQDCYHDSYQGAPMDGSAWLKPRCSRRVVRGGGFDSTASSLRFAKRDNQYATARLNNVGFRVARDE